MLGAGTLNSDPKCRGGETSGKAINVDGKIKFVRKHWHLEEAHPILGEVVWVRCLELKKDKKYRLEVRDDEAALELSLMDDGEVDDDMAAADPSPAPGKNNKKGGGGGKAPAEEESPLPPKKKKKGGSSSEPAVVQVSSQAAKRPTREKKAPAK